MRRRLTFLIGAHKTASTHLQRALVAQRAALAPAGVGVIGPMPIGGTLLPLSELLRGRAEPDLLALASEGFLHKHAGDAETVVLMNENILSASLAPDMAFKDGQLYKFAPQRVKRVLDLFPGHDIQVGMAVRNPAGFLVSSWQEHMKGHAFRPFRDYLGTADVAEIGWLKPVRRLRQALGDTPIFLWRYEDYPTIASRVLHQCMGEAGARITLPESAANPGFSARALDYLAEVGQVTPETTAEALRRFPKGPGYPAFQPWTQREKTAMSERYDQDLQRIASRGLARVLHP